MVTAKIETKPFEKIDEISDEVFTVIIDPYRKNPICMTIKVSDIYLDDPPVNYIIRPEDFQTIDDVLRELVNAVIYKFNHLLKTRVANAEECDYFTRKVEGILRDKDIRKFILTSLQLNDDAIFKIENSVNIRES